MKVETGAFVFAIVNAIIVTAGTLCCICFFGMILRIKVQEQEMKISSLFLITLSIECLVCAVIAQVFAVLLCVGISKKRHRFVLAYLVYGIVTEILSVIGIVCFICMKWGEWNLVVCGACLLGVCGIYAMLLLLVRQTYIVLSDSSPAEHRRLINNQYDF